MIFSALSRAACRVTLAPRNRLPIRVGTAAAFFCSSGFFCSAMWSQQTEPATPVVVQPGAPGKPSKPLPPSTRAKLPPRSQADVEFMQGMIMHHVQAVEMSRHSSHQQLMPGMLTPEQMEALRKAKDAEFDHLFLTGMIQHHDGALTMVKDLFDTAGAGQDADVFNFATDADNTQRAEIKIMQSMLDKKSSEEKR